MLIWVYVNCNELSYILIFYRLYKITHSGNLILGKMSNLDTVQFLADLILSTTPASSNTFCNILKFVWKILLFLLPQSIRNRT